MGNNTRNCESQTLIALLAFRLSGFSINFYCPVVVSVRLDCPVDEYPEREVVFINPMENNVGVVYLSIDQDDILAGKYTFVGRGRSVF